MPTDGMPSAGPTSAQGLNVIPFIAEALVLAGTVILSAALVPVRQLTAQLPPGQVRRRWYALTALIIAFIVGYAAYAVMFWSRLAELADLSVPSVFFSGACFVWLTATLSLQTALDVRRVALLEYENIIDPLLGIYNRRYLDRRLKEECARAKRYALPLSVLLLDIDHVKQINDEYGRPVGDLVQNYLGKLVVSAIRESDVVSRYWGEELVVIAPDTLLTASVTLAERLRQYVQSHQFVLSSASKPNTEIGITVSIGVAALGPEIDNVEKFVQAADQALYRAKQEGRNRAVMWSATMPKVIIPSEGRYDAG